jgi:excisionase family DNA binding protein
MSAELEREPILPQDAEMPGIRRIEDLFARARPRTTPRLVGPDGEQLPLPTPVYTLLRRMVHELARGNAVTVVPVHAVLTTQQAADLLNTSRPFLVKLLESGEIPFHRVGTHRRIRFRDLMAYRRRREQAEAGALDEMARMAQEMGLYE